MTTNLTDEELARIERDLDERGYCDRERVAKLLAEIREHRSLLRRHDSKHHPSIGSVPRISHEAIMDFVMRCEMIVEEASERLQLFGPSTPAERTLVAHLDDAVTNLRQLLAESVQAREAAVVQAWRAGNVVAKPWPTNEPPQYNGSGEPCDAWQGPCSCGAWHDGRRVDSSDSSPTHERSK